MARRLRKAWPLLLSLVGHGAALAALAFFLVRADRPGDASSPPRIGLAPVAAVDDAPETQETEPPVMEQEPAFPDDLWPRPRLPEAPPEPVVLPDLADEDLPPLEAEEPAWVVVDIPLRVAQRRLRGAAAPSAPAAQPPPASRPPPASVPAGGAPARLPPLRPIHAPQYYPREAIASRMEGRVVVEVTVHTSGAVMGTRLITSSGHPVLDRAALASARQWRFAPIERTRKAAIPFRFGL